MKNFLLIVCAFFAFALCARIVSTEDADFRGHVQGIAADETGIYCSFSRELLKVDFAGKTLLRCPSPFHSGDVTTDGEKIYVSVSISDETLVPKYGAKCCIFIYDRNCKLLEVKPFKNLRGIDGIAFINGRFYIGLNYLGARLRTENKIAIMDHNFNLLKIATVTIGKNTKFGPQTLNNFRGKLIAGFYGGGKNSFIYDLEELNNSDTVVKPIGAFPENTTVGFSLVPAKIAKDETFIVARNRRQFNEKAKRFRFGIRFHFRPAPPDEKIYRSFSTPTPGK